MTDIVDQVGAGAAAQFIGIDDDGAFGPAGEGDDGEWILMRRLELGAMMKLARAIVAGEPRAITTPTALLDLAVALLAVAGQCGRLTLMLEEVSGTCGRLSIELDGHERKAAEAMG